MISEINFTNANSRDTYFTVHNIREAYKNSLGQGVNVGIIDWLFDVDNNKKLYSGYADISQERQFLFESAGHGLIDGDNT